jgi:Na+-translocating ferredoxin:NAD+ oxidoreductase subunit G
MRELINMVVVLTLISAFSGGLLAKIKDSTSERIENQTLEFVKGPAIRGIFKGSSNDPIADRFKLKSGDAEESFFVGKFDGTADSVAFESFAKGFGGYIGVMVGVNLKDDKLIGVAVTTHNETPGVGALAKTEPDFAAQFKGKPFTGAFKIRGDGGQVDALSGATVTSRGIATALTDAEKMYKNLKPQIEEKLKSFSN